MYDPHQTRGMGAKLVLTDDLQNTLRAEAQFLLKAQKDMYHVLADDGVSAEVARLAEREKILNTDQAHSLHQVRDLWDSK